MHQISTIGKVIIAGAGPGDPELITVKLWSALQCADVILVDRLVNPSIIEKYASKKAVIITAGKQGYNDASIPQLKINELIIHHALKGRNVLRLKGGDVAFFSNVLDELDSLYQQNISFEIIPGITAASGASAYTGIPLTARSYAQGVQLLTFLPEEYSEPDRWKTLAQTNDTLVFYMAAQHLHILVQQLLSNGKESTTPIAIIEQATTQHQQTHISNLAACEEKFSNTQFSSPTIVIVGKVVNLYQKNHWFTPTAPGSVFKELIKEPALH